MQPGPDRPHGFTLIEMVIVVAVIAILTAAAFWIPRNAMRNASLSSAAWEVSLRLGGLRSAAMAEGQDYLFVIVDAPGNDGMGCEVFSPGGCATYFILSNPSAAWSLAAFDPGAPAANAQLVDSQTLPKGARLETALAAAPPAPFDNVTISGPTDTALVGTCGGRSCMAVRFAQSGTARPEFAVPGAARPGWSFVLGSNLPQGVAERKGIVVGSPTGIVKTFPY
jgi:prepilin-type N-terminal cleavage/methylation domain-containing protein